MRGRMGLRLHVKNMNGLFLKKRAARTGVLGTRADRSGSEDSNLFRGFTEIGN